MRFCYVLPVLMLLATPVTAQNITFSTRSSGSIAAVTTSSVIASIDQNGNVTIDWRAVETAAAGPMDQLGQYARLMLAIRDKTYKEPTR